MTRNSKEPTAVMALTHTQRKLLAKLFPILADRLKIDEPSTRKLHCTLEEIQEIVTVCQAEESKAEGTIRNSLRHIIAAASTIHNIVLLKKAGGFEAFVEMLVKSETDEVAEIIEKLAKGGIDDIPAAERVYQFKITLLHCEPPIWRRIQTKDCTLDKLHERIQLAMGWTNSHLHEFEINGVHHGDPELLDDGWLDYELVDSRRLKISKLVPTDGKQLCFQYEYDFGDGWEHEILFEGCIQAEKGTRYPLCVEGERACPPEDVGGTDGYAEYLEAMADPEHEEHESFMRWRGPFDPEKFDPQAVTKKMQRGLPNWRNME